MTIAEIRPQSVPPEPARRGLRIDRSFTKDGVHPYDEVEWERRDAKIGGEGGGTVFEQKGVEVPKFWSMTATNVVASKYFRGKLTSPDREWSVKQMVDRVVDRITKWGIEGGYFTSDRDSEIFNHELKYLMVHQHASFNSPVWFNIGVEGVPQQASACQPYRARVSTPYGAMQIGEIVEKDLRGLPVYDSAGTTFVVATKHNGRKRVFRVQLTSGSFIEATADHLVSVTQTYGSKATDWKRVDELKVGQQLRLMTDRAAVAAREAVPVLKAAELIVRTLSEVTAGGSEGPQFAELTTLRISEADVDVSKAMVSSGSTTTGRTDRSRSNSRSRTQKSGRGCLPISMLSSRTSTGTRHLTGTYPTTARYGYTERSSGRLSRSTDCFDVATTSVCHNRSGLADRKS